MFKKAILCLCSAFVLGFCEDYIVLEKPFNNAKNSVIEIFAYRCGHCYNHHHFGTLQKLKKSLPNLSFNIYPVSLMNGKIASQMNEFFAYAYLKDKENNTDASDKNSLSEQLADAYFRAYFVNKQEFNDIDAFVNFSLQSLKISKEELNKTLQSDKAKNILNEYAYANEVARTFGTPAFVVNGKYQIKPEAVISLEALQNLIEELSKKE
ncbi:thiol:disulfide interchange protein DsbA/DsbL [Campylobacter sp. LR264d]|uniref:thiol:disulfide interchange protein DsbA/DsbL n=1 Tax=unclassified Campylobacter TaxID=2593542 RepID=UPI001237D0F9|nr:MULTISPECIES: thiol:disulfide interchange protein DsbA/DsbL [unclassified Campylobacter]KAA6220596.1 thiol:disulfide interchange protein DsbA/DsbL [Campylobacter sp. LR185c]KAA6226768.1 thiol:disulfide interchange protein DsbA/DsbL [Campylobacter sp. LR196d]KAA6233726.1 thiol:disulfide interchange protein DsbA/DsbL [Campylobacter sp. LR264d]KAA8604261.1 protein-disulfide isomerase [Campylobacter sp. LR185c]